MDDAHLLSCVATGSRILAWPLQPVDPRRVRHQQSAIVLLAAAVACGDPAGPTRNVTLSFCAGTLWAGVQNEGQDWVTIANGPTDATIDVSERLIVARIRGGNNGELAFYYLTRDQAQATFICPSPGTKQLSGSVAGTSGLTQIAIGNSAEGTGTLFTSFTLTNVQDGPLDLVATHRNTAIIRRRVNYANGATIPVLDFSSAEAFALQAHTLAIELNGIVAPQWGTAIMTNGGTRANLSSSGPPCCTDGRIYTLPASRQESGDRYHLIVTVPDLSSVAGFPSGWPRLPTPGGWLFSASDAPWLFSASRARAGDVHRSANTAS